MLSVSGSQDRSISHRYMEMLQMFCTAYVSCYCPNSCFKAFPLPAILTTSWPDSKCFDLLCFIIGLNMTLFVVGNYCNLASYRSGQMLPWSEKKYESHGDGIMISLKILLQRKYGRVKGLKLFPFLNSKTYVPFSISMSMYSKLKRPPTQSI